ncbi:MAG: hypothetical protein JW881_11330 [Spirochaetales bacterium]|nr:hypothetical protein [Spirochaetales bacterium]
MRKSNYLYSLLFLFIVQWPLFCQIGERIDILLEEKTVQSGTAVYAILSAGGIVSEDATIEEALGVLREKEWKLTIESADTPLTLGEAAYLLMKTFDLKGGVMYSIFPGPRYAVRELVYLKIITDRPDPSRTVSGRELIDLISRVIDRKESAS